MSLDMRVPLMSLEMRVSPMKIHLMSLEIRVPLMGVSSLDSSNRFCY
jgi:hypothetical protein